MHDQPADDRGEGSGPPDGYPPEQPYQAQQPPYGPPPGQGPMPPNGGPPSDPGQQYPGHAQPSYGPPPSDPGPRYPGGQQYPGQAQQPPYGQPPSDPGQQPYPGGSTPPYGQPGYGQPAYGQGPPAPWGPPTQVGQDMGGFGPPENPTATWGMPPGPPPKRGSRLIIVAAVVAVIVVLGGGAAIVVALSGNSTHATKPVKAAASTPVSTVTTPAPIPTPSSALTPSDTPSLSLDPVLTAPVGDCLANDGTMSHAKLVASGCHSGTYKLLKRLYATTDDTKCKTVDGSDITFTRRTKYSFLDMVLCMKKL